MLDGEYLWQMRVVGDQLMANQGRGMCVPLVAA